MDWENHQKELVCFEVFEALCIFWLATGVVSLENDDLPHAQVKDIAQDQKSNRYINAANLPFFIGSISAFRNDVNLLYQRCNCQ